MTGYESIQLYISLSEFPFILGMTTVTGPVLKWSDFFLNFHHDTTVAKVQSFKYKNEKHKPKFYPKEKE